MDILDRLKIEARKEPHEPIWRDAIAEIEKIRWDTQVNAFVDGAKFWEFHQTGATMWQSDQETVKREAVRLFKQDQSEEPS